MLQFFPGPIGINGSMTRPDILHWTLEAQSSLAIRIGSLNVRYCTEQYPVQVRTVEPVVIAFAHACAEKTRYWFRYKLLVGTVH